MAAGETVILFVRRKNRPEQPYYTMEVKNGKIVQCRGKCNKNTTKELKKLLEQYEKNILNRQEERRAG